MPVFNDMNLSPQDKADIITYLKYLENNPSPAGSNWEASAPSPKASSSGSSGSARSSP
jgi:hypothetical protein